MADHGTAFTDKRQAVIESRVKKIYGDAKKDVERRLKEHLAHYKKKNAEMLKQLAEGKITQQRYNQWVAGQVFMGERWKEKREAITSSLYHSNVIANGLVNGQRKAVFAENANFQAFKIAHDSGSNDMGISFTLYDNATVTRLLRDRPELMKRRVINGVTDRAWNKRIISDTIAKGVITGKKIDEIADEIAEKTAYMNESATVRYARTCMTSAQNAGRIAAMNDAADMGIKVKKKWLATLDGRTRDSHAALDGQVREINEPFDSPLGEIMFPGDPSASAANVWNCRCTMINEYEEYNAKDESARRDNEDDEVIADMNYAEWKATKKAGVLKQYSDAKKEYYHWQEAVKANDADHVFKGIWKNDVTYADYLDKEASIPAKRNYFQQKIIECEKRGDKAAADMFRKYLEELELFARDGLNNQAILDFRKQALEEVEKIYKQAVNDTIPKGAGPFDSSAYSQDRKDKALWAKDPREADNALRAKSGEVWQNSNYAQREAIHTYTSSYHMFNEPLRGEEYGTNRFLGVGNTDLDAGSRHNGERLNNMTDIIDKCSYDIDVWLQRGTGFDGMDRFFQCSRDLLEYGTQKELEAELLGKPVTEYAFMSCGTSKGKGFSFHPIIMNIYAPSGTKMMYVEPISAYGAGDGLSWDGKSKQSYFRDELETILQQGTQFRITKVERRGGKLYVDMEVIDQSKQQRWKK